MIARFAAAPGGGYRPDRLAALTDREREVLAPSRAALSNAEIAAALFTRGGRR